MKVKYAFVKKPNENEVYFNNNNNQEWWGMICLSANKNESGPFFVNRPMKKKFQITQDGGRGVSCGRDKVRIKKKTIFFLHLFTFLKKYKKVILVMYC